MNKFFLAITAFWICAISINAQVGRPFPTRLDDFHKYTTTPSNVTTETLKCSSNSNLYIKIDIHREYGIPRYGIITDCHQNVDTVSYISNNFVRSQGGGIPSPWLKDSNITIWWKEGNFNVKIMDILTGTIVLDETHIMVNLQMNLIKKLILSNSKILLLL